MEEKGREREVKEIQLAITKRRKELNRKRKSLKSNIEIQKLYYNIKCDIDEEHEQYKDVIGNDFMRHVITSSVRYD